MVEPSASALPSAPPTTTTSPLSSPKPMSLHSPSTTDSPRNTLFLWLMKIHDLPSNGLLLIQADKAEPWLNDTADFERVFIAGDSAGANIAHNTAVKAGVEAEELVGVKMVGICLVHPDFVGREGNVNKSWFFACPETNGSGDPRINPAVDLRLGRMGCRRVVVCVAEKDGMRERGWFYYETLKKCEWDGVVEIMEAKGEEHVFHLFDPTCENALALLKKLASFINLE